MVKLVYFFYYSHTNSETIWFFINQQSFVRIDSPPILKNKVAVGLAGDLVCQDLQNFDAGHDSGFVYQHARQ